MSRMSGWVSNRLQDKKNLTFSDFLTPAVPLARGGLGDRRIPERDFVVKGRPWDIFR